MSVFSAFSVFSVAPVFSVAVNSPWPQAYP
jgi:hypothetical protein